MCKAARVLVTLVSFAVLAGCSPGNQGVSSPPPVVPAPSDKKPADPGNRSAYRAEAKGREILVAYGPATSDAARIFGLDQLPATAAPAGAPAGTAFGTAAHGYHTVILNDNHTRLAFSTQGDVHGVIALLDVGVVNGKLAGQNLKILDLLFEGGAPRLLFSADGAYLAAEVNQPSGRMAVALYQVAGGKVQIIGLPRDASVSLIGWENKMLRVQDGNQAVYAVDPGTGKATRP